MNKIEWYAARPSPVILPPPMLKLRKPISSYTLLTVTGMAVNKELLVGTYIARVHTKVSDMIFPFIFMEDK
jgi:hypothetical protein